MCFEFGTTWPSPLRSNYWMERDFNGIPSNWRSHVLHLDFHFFGFTVSLRTLACVLKTTDSSQIFAKSAITFYVSHFWKFERLVIVFSFNSFRFFISLIFYVGFRLVSISHPHSRAWQTRRAAYFDSLTWLFLFLACSQFRQPIIFIKLSFFSLLEDFSQNKNLSKNMPPWKNFT